MKVSSPPYTTQNFSYTAIAAFVGFLGFISQPSAYTWGEQDMMPFFERIFDPGFLPNDFFTNTVAIKNPRWVFGYFIVLISWTTTLSWYKTLYILKLVMAIASPILHFEVLRTLLKKYVSGYKVDRLAPILLFLVILMVFFKEYRYYFSVASWFSYNTSLHAYNVSLLLSFIAILLKERGNCTVLYLSLFLASCSIHPAMGLFAIWFYFIFLFPKLKDEWQNMLLILGASIFAVISVKFAFSNEMETTTSDFILVYVKERHPWHYHVPDYFNPKGNWIHFFVLMNTLYLIPYIVGILKKTPSLRTLSLLSILSYSGSIIVQYVFIDFFPVKIIAYMGVSRFTTFGYWLAVVLWGIMLAEFMNEKKLFVFPSLRIKTLCLIILNLFLVGILFIDNPKEKYYNNQKEYYDFVRSTPDESIFITYSSRLNTDMRIIGQRGVFISDEFPFTEQFVLEYGERRQMIYGSRVNGFFGVDYYRQLSPRDFVEISTKHQLDYILIENDHAHKFNLNTPVWKDQKHSIYAIKNLKL